MILNLLAAGAAKVKAITAASADALPAALDGTIAIVSAVSAGAVYVQGTAPDDPAAGDVWVLVDASGDNIITLGNVQVYPAQARQYVDGAWADVTAYLRMNGAWVVLAYPSVYLYNRGDQCTDVTSGWNGGKWYSGAYAFETDKIKLTVANGGNQPSAVETKQPVDVTKYKALKFVGSAMYTGETARITFGLLPSSLISAADGTNMENGFAASWQNNPGDGDWEKTLDISEYTGEYYIGLIARKNIYIHEVILEG